MKHKEDQPIDWIEYLQKLYPMKDKEDLKFGRNFYPNRPKAAKESVKGRQADGVFKTKNEGIW